MVEHHFHAVGIDEPSLLSALKLDRWRKHDWGLRHHIVRHGDDSIVLAEPPSRTQLPLQKPSAEEIESRWCQFAKHIEEHGDGFEEVGLRKVGDAGAGEQRSGTDC